MLFRRVTKWGRDIKVMSSLIWYCAFQEFQSKPATQVDWFDINTFLSFYAFFESQDDGSAWFHMVPAPVWLQYSTQNWWIIIMTNAMWHAMWIKALWARPGFCRAVCLPWKVSLLTGPWTNFHRKSQGLNPIVSHSQIIGKNRDACVLWLVLEGFHVEISMHPSCVVWTRSWKLEKDLSVSLHWFACPHLPSKDVSPSNMSMGTDINRLYIKWSPALLWSHQLQTCDGVFLYHWCPDECR